MAAVAPMDLVIKDDPASIPLKCTLCPKKPNFSDVSHLLTHISSKSHLSHRFKTELRSSTEREAREAIELYEDWYERHGIHVLLAERMAAKEQKKPNKRGRAPDGGSKSRPLPKNSEEIKTEPDDQVESASMMTQWTHPSLQLHSVRHGYFDNTGYQTPVLKRSRSVYSIGDTPENMMRPKYERWPSETETTESALPSEVQSEITESVDDDDDSSKLKGVRYPGMGLFDSANELQKRKRNQRKDESVLRNMEQTSSGIEPTEFVWTEVGEFQRTRDIYASPSIEGSPERKLADTVNNKKRRNRRVTSAAPTGRQRHTRSSARISDSKATSKINASRGRDSALDPDDQDLPRAPSRRHTSVDIYDVFNDIPQPSPGMRTPGFTGDEQSLPVSLAVRTESPPEGAGLEQRRRPALQSINANAALLSSAPKPPTSIQHSYFPTRHSGSGSFASHPPVTGNPYFQHQHGLGGGSFNPLCVQSRGGYMDHYAFSNYGTDPKPPTSNLQSIGPVRTLGSLSYGNSFPTPYASDSPCDRPTTDYDI